MPWEVPPAEKHNNWLLNSTGSAAASLPSPRGVYTVSKRLLPRTVRNRDQSRIYKPTACSVVQSGLNQLSYTVWITDEHLPLSLTALFFTVLSSKYGPKYSPIKVPGSSFQLTNPKENSHTLMIACAIHPPARLRESELTLLESYRAGLCKHIMSQPAWPRAEQQSRPPGRAGGFRSFCLGPEHGMLPSFLSTSLFSSAVSQAYCWKTRREEKGISL